MQTYSLQTVDEAVKLNTKIGNIIQVQTTSSTPGSASFFAYNGGILISIYRTNGEGDRDGYAAVKISESSVILCKKQGMNNILESKEYTNNKIRFYNVPAYMTIIYIGS